jgi:hypothetical protein
MEVEKNKVRCNVRRCDWRGLQEDVLTAPNPFDNEDTIIGCPNCKSIDTIETVCDEDGCWELVTCGTPTENGYRTTCYKHVPK